jgi:hypothetical protein
LILFVAAAPSPCLKKKKHFQRLGTSAQQLNVFRSGFFFKTKRVRRLLLPQQQSKYFIRLLKLWSRLIRIARLLFPQITFTRTNSTESKERNTDKLGELVGNLLFVFIFSWPIGKSA